MDNLREKFEQIIENSGEAWEYTNRTKVVPLLYVKELLELYDLALSEQRGWVDVKERLPKTENWMRVCIDGEPSVIPCNYSGGRWWEYGASSIPPITHWKEFNDVGPVTNKQNQ